MSKDELKRLFSEANRIGNRRYHKLTAETFQQYRAFDHWRYIAGDGECGTTPESQQWVRDNSDYHCPICSERYQRYNGRSIDHKLPRSQYPWLSLNFQNLWVICMRCNRSKGERHWYDYEHHMLTHHEDLYPAVRLYRPTKLLNELTLSEEG